MQIMFFSNCLFVAFMRILFGSWNECVEYTFYRPTVSEVLLNFYFAANMDNSASSCIMPGMKFMP